MRDRLPGSPNDPAPVLIHLNYLEAFGKGVIDRMIAVVSTLAIGEGREGLMHPVQEVFRSGLQITGRVGFKFYIAYGA